MKSRIDICVELAAQLKSVDMLQGFGDLAVAQANIQQQKSLQNERVESLMKENEQLQLQIQKIKESSPGGWESLSNAIKECSRGPNDKSCSTIQEEISDESMVLLFKERQNKIEVFRNYKQLQAFFVAANNMNPLQRNLIQELEIDLRYITAYPSLSLSLSSPSPSAYELTRSL